MMSGPTGAHRASTVLRLSQLMLMAGLSGRARPTRAVGSDIEIDIQTSLALTQRIFACREYWARHRPDPSFVIPQQSLLRLCVLPSRYGPFFSDKAGLRLAAVPQRFLEKGDKTHQLRWHVRIGQMHQMDGPGWSRPVGK